MLDRVHDQEIVISPVHTIDRSICVDGGMALVGAEFIMGERCRSSPLPQSKHDVAFDSLRTRRHRRQLAILDASGPIREHGQTPRSPIVVHRRIHSHAVLPNLDTVIPRRHHRGKSPQLRLDLSCGLIANLMAGLAPCFHLPHPIALRLHFGVDSVPFGTGAGEIALGRNIRQGIPVVGRIILSGSARVRSDHRRQGQRLAWHGLHGR